METMDLVQVLEATSSPNTETLQAAQQSLEQGAMTNLPGFLTSLAAVLADVSKSEVSRMAAGLQLKNYLTSRNEEVKLHYQAAWLAMEESVRKHIKSLVIYDLVIYHIVCPHSILPSLYSIPQAIPQFIPPFPNPCTLPSPTVLTALVEERGVYIISVLYYTVQVLSTLGTENQLHRSAAQCVAYIAVVELPRNMWPDLILSLVSNVTSPQSTEQLKEASLDAIGYICEDLDPKLLASQSNEILTAIVQGMRKEEPSNSVRLAATKALYNSLEFTKANFEKENERHFIMQVVCEATQGNDPKIQVAALQNLVKIMSLYYVHMEAYMGPALFAITVAAIRNESDAVALQGIEFWSTVCDEEADLAIELAEATDSGHPPDQISRFYVKGAMQYLVPLLLERLAQQDELDDEDDWNPCKAAGVCLSLMAGVCEDAIVPLVFPFVLTNMGDQNWKRRDAAIMALGSIMEGPEPDELQKYVVQVVEPLIALVSDEMVQVKDSAAWTIGRVCERCPAVLLNDKYIMPLLTALFDSLEGEPRVAVNACWAFSSLAEAAFDTTCEELDEEEPKTFCLSSSCEAIISKLFITADRSDAGTTSNLRSSAYEALMDMIKYSAQDCYPVVLKTTLAVLERLKNLLELSVHVSGTDKQQLSDLGSLLCATLQSSLRKMKKEDVLKVCDVVMDVLLKLHGIVQEDTLMTIGVVVDGIGDLFLKYMDPFKPYLLNALARVEETDVCLAAVGLVGDLCRNLSNQITPYCPELMHTMGNDLTSPSTHQSLKPPILSAFGDVALAIGSGFKLYLEIVLQLLQQAAELDVGKDNFDAIDYGNDLRDGCLEAYTGIIQGFKSSPDDHLLSATLTHVPVMMDLIFKIAKDEDRSETNVSNALGLFGDLCTTYGSHLGELIQSSDKYLPWLNKLLTEGRRSKVKRTKQVALWAAKELKQLQTSPNK